MFPAWPIAFRPGSPGFFSCVSGLTHAFGDDHKSMFSFPVFCSGAACGLPDDFGHGVPVDAIGLWFAFCRFRCDELRLWHAYLRHRPILFLAFGTEAEGFAGFLRMISRVL